ncbi:ATP-binding protein [Candidatus Woesearchaeota archaeon]|nr:ATP-binding protein [Candidatus Woesearchaeota archaeon]
MPKLSIRKTAGQDLLTTVRDLATGDFIHSIIELVANSYDADATEVRIDYDPQAGTLRIKDDGEGMDKKGLESFFRSGDSEKKARPLTPRGRPKLGNFGIATVLISHLGSQYDLTTQQANSQITLSETFKDHLKLEDVVDCETRTVRRKDHGTEIRISDLKFTEEDISIPSLRRRIQWNLPVQMPDFDVYVNGKKVEAKSIEKAVTFRFEYAGLGGPSEGDIHLCTRPQRERGIHLYVDGRRVGDPQEILMAANKSVALTGKVVGIIQANGFKEHMTFDRTKIKDGKPYREFVAKLGATLAKVRQYQEQLEKSADQRRHEETLEDAAEVVERLFKSKGVAELGRGVSLVLSWDLEPGEIGTIDRGEKYVEINRGHPLLALPPGTKRPVLEQAIQSAVVDLIAGERVKEAKRSEQLDLYRSTAQEIWRQLRPADALRASRSSIQNDRVYNRREVMQRLDLTLTEYEHLVGTGAIKSGDSKGVNGYSLRRFLEVSAGMTAVYDLLLDQFDNAAVKREVVYNVLSDIKSMANPLILDLGSPGDPCFFVDDTCTSVLLDCINTISRGIGSHSKAVESFSEIIGGAYTVNRLNEMLEGVGKIGINAALAYAKKVGTRGLEASSNGTRMIQLVPFIKVLRSKRKADYRAEEAAKSERYATI